MKSVTSGKAERLKEEVKYLSDKEETISQHPKNLDRDEEDRREVGISLC